MSWTARILPAVLVLTHGLAAAQKPPCGPIDFDYAYIRWPVPYYAARRTAEGLRYASPDGRESFLMPKPPRVFRIFILGGSSARHLKQHADVDGWALALAAGAPGWRVEILNAAQGGSDSHRDLLRTREVAGYSPDALVILSGNNEFYAPRWLRFPRLARWRARLRERLFGAAPAPSPSRKEQEPIFEANVREMLRLTRRAGALPILCTLPNNLADYAPLSLFPWNDADFAAGWRALNRRQFAAAERAFGAYVRRRPRDPLGRFYLARAAESGDPSLARREYAAAADLDADLYRCPPSRAERLRALAREESAVLADLERDFRALDPRLGAAVLMGGVHVFPEYNDFALGAVASAVAAASPRFTPATVEALKARRTRPPPSPPSERRRLTFYHLLTNVLVPDERQWPLAEARVVESLRALDASAPGTLQSLPALKADIFESAANDNCLFGADAGEAGLKRRWDFIAEAARRLPSSR